MEVREVYFKYPGGVEVLKKTSFKVKGGEVVAIIGPNGCGKTTLLLVASGLLEPDRGEVLLEGKPLKKQLPEARRKIGLVFQDPDDQLFNPTVYDEIAFALRQLLDSSQEVDLKVLEMAKQFNLENLLDKPPYKLSVGEKRIVTLASVLVYSPDVLLLDEPTANLSSRFIEEVENVILKARDEHKAIVVTSHDIEFVARVADRVYVMNDGVLLGGSDKEVILTNEKLLSLADMRPPLTLQVLKLLNVELENSPLTIKDLSKQVYRIWKKISD